MKTKVIAFDVYGTILATEDPENELPPRNGFLEFAKKCIKSKLILVTSSDAYVSTMKCDLRASNVPLALFINFFPMTRGKPKNFKSILNYFEIEPEELLVFGDKFNIDIEPAKELGCRAILVPEYIDRHDIFHWNSIEL